MVAILLGLCMHHVTFGRVSHRLFFSLTTTLPRQRSP